ncbi:hypothetical protein PGH43_17450 [Legionella pneumophila 130b]|nr:hypothetical protein PGH43_17450 [Legionella pneumophila 130b]
MLSYSGVYAGKRESLNFLMARNSGSFLMLDDDANIKFFNRKNEADMQLHYDLALDNGASGDILDQLHNGEKFLVFGNLI